MISFSLLAVTGGALYGSVKALRFWQNRERPLWLREAQLAAATVTVEGDTAGGAPLAGAVVVEADKEGMAALTHYLLYNKEGRKLSIITLTGSTALIHIVLGLQTGIPLFIWNGAGFIAFLAGQYFTPQLEPYRAEVRDGFIAYSGTTIVAYFLLNGAAGLLNPVGMTTKVIEAGLIGLLWQEEGAG
jgi:hypothetical protein